MYLDYHVHTNYSDDSDYLMEDVVRDAISLKIDELCFCDHVDYGVKSDWNDKIKLEKMNVNYELYFDEINKLKDKYKDKITLKRGLEFGIQTHTIDKFQSLFSKYDFDFVILSCHQVNNLEFHTQDFQREKSQKEYNEEYYKEILSVIKKYKNYSVLGHLDLIKRYDLKGNYPFKEIKSIIEDIFKIIINENKGIEINTSSIRYGINDSTPSREILELYRDMGGKIISIGSDSHKKEHLGKYIYEAKDLLRDIGFKYYCSFENMEPIYHSL